MTSGDGGRSRGTTTVTLRRRALLGRAGAALGTGALASLAGCGFLSTEDESDGVDEGRAAAVPATDAFVHVDVDALAADADLRAGFDRRLAALPADTWAAGRPESMDEALVALDRRFGLDGSAVSELLVFGTLGETGAAEGVLLWGDWDGPAEALAAREGTRAVGTYRGTAVYQADGATVAAVDGGPVVVGSRGAVRSVLDVHAGANESVGGGLTRAFASTSGSIRFVSRVAPSLFSVGAAGDWVDLRPLERAGPLSGSLRERDGQRRLRATVDAESEDAADDVRALANAARVQAKRNAASLAASVPALPTDDRSVATLRALFDGTEVARSGTTVTATYGATAATTGELLAVLLPLVGASLSGGA